MPPVADESDRKRARLAREAPCTDLANIHFYATRALALGSACGRDDDAQTQVSTAPSCADAGVHVPTVRLSGLSDGLSLIADHCDAEGRCRIARTCHEGEVAVREARMAKAHAVRAAARALLERVATDADAARVYLADACTAYYETDAEGRSAAAPFAASLLADDWVDRCLSALPHRCATHDFPLPVCRAIQMQMCLGGSPARRMDEVVSALALRRSLALDLLEEAAAFTPSLTAHAARRLQVLAMRLLAAAVAAPLAFDAVRRDLPSGAWRAAVELAGPDAPTIVLPDEGSMRPDSARERRWAHLVAPVGAHHAYDVHAANMLHVPSFAHEQPGYPQTVHELIGTLMQHGGMRAYDKEPLHRTVRRWCERSGLRVVRKWPIDGRGERSGAMYSCTLPLTRAARDPDFHAGPVTRLLDAGEGAMRAFACSRGHLRMVLRTGAAPLLFLAPPTRAAA